VTVVDRQPGPALETSYANAGEVSFGYCSPWAAPGIPMKALKWMFDKEAPLLFRPQLDWDQWRWGLKFLAQCNDTAFERNVQQIVALGAYSHAALKDLVASTGIENNRLERGIAHFYTDQKSFDAAGHAVELMRKFGVQRRLVSRDELLRIEPALRSFADRIVGGTYTESDESGDCRAFTQKLLRLCQARGLQTLNSFTTSDLSGFTDPADDPPLKFGIIIFGSSSQP
jgi:D-amino-acid dehydrogenase